MGFHVLLSRPNQWQTALTQLNAQTDGEVTFWAADTSGAPETVRQYTPQDFAAALQPQDIVVHCRGGESFSADTRACVCQAFAEDPNRMLVYGDSHVEGIGHLTYRPGTIHRPAFAPLFLSNYNYIGDSAFLRGAFLVEHPELITADFACSNYGVLLVLARTPEVCYHLPQVLLLEDELFVQRDPARVETDARLLAQLQPVPSAQVQTTGSRFRITGPHKESVTVLAALPSGFTPEEYLSLLKKRTAYPLAVFLLLCPADALPAGHAPQFLGFDRLTASAYDEVARTIHSDYLFFLNAAVLPRQNDWIEGMLDVLTFQDAGAVSPLVTRPDIRILHAGMERSGSALLESSFKDKLFSRAEDLFYNQTDLRECITVCPYAFAVPRRDFLALDGFSDGPEDPASAFADFGLRLRQAGRSCAYTPHSYLVSREEATVDAAALLSRWGKMLNRDPFITADMVQKYERRELDWQIASRRAPFTLPSKALRVAVLADGADALAAREALAQARATFGQDCFCCLFTATPPDTQLQPDEHTDLVYNARLLLGTGGADRFVAGFDRIFVASMLYSELLKQLTGVRDRIVMDSGLPEPPAAKPGFYGVGQVESILAAPAPSMPIDVIVPVYNGYDYLARLFACIPHTVMPFRLLIVNDCSPDERVLPLLREAAARIPNTELLENEKNLGFVQSVNRALRRTRGHVAIVNTDVELPTGWLERLMTPILCSREVASSTPFTNSGTICSFPNFAENNAIFWGDTVEQVDAAFREMKPDYYELPTGVGFCMGMSRYALDEIGPLDTEVFEKGYGEENDWCLRAQTHGFKNVLVNNLFVYHKHGGSFIPEEKQRLIDDHMRILNQRYPFYGYDVGSFIERDPYRRYRLHAAILACAAHMHGAEGYLTFNWSGGAVSYLQQQRARILQEGKAYLAVIYDEAGGTFWVDFALGEEQYMAKGLTADEAFDVLRLAKPATLTINELVSYPNLPRFLGRIAAFQEETGIFLRMLVHDFFCLCPCYTLVNNQFIFCGLPEEEACCRCAATNNHFSGLTRDIHAWRAAWGNLLAHCQEVVCFSQDSRNQVLRVYPNLDPVVRPHKVEPLPEVQRDPSVDGTIHIAVIGGISEVKGLNIIKEMSRLGLEQKLPVQIVIIGYTSEYLVADNITITGRYQRAELPELMRKHHIDLVLIPSVWPETFSYTTQEAITMQMPLAVFNLGAPAERVSQYDKGLVLSHMDAQTALDEIQQFLLEKGFRHGE